MADATTSNVVSCTNESAGQEMSSEARRDHKKKRKRATAEEQDEELELIKSDCQYKSKKSWPRSKNRFRSYFVSLKA